MVRRGEMMSVEDVEEILAVPLIGVIPDDEQVVVATNQGERLQGRDPLPDGPIRTSAAGFSEKKCPIWILRQRGDFSGVFSKNRRHKVCFMNGKHFPEWWRGNV